MSRIALLCPEPLGHGQPAGVGIRFIEIARVLIGAGHVVDVMSPDGGSPSGGRGVPLSPRAIAEVTAAADAVVAQGHVVNDFITFGADRPLVVDLYDPFIVENFHYWKERGSKVFEHDHATLLRSLRRGDLFLCASESQRLFYLGALLAERRIAPKAFHDDPTLGGLIRIAPFGVPPARSAPGAKERSPHLFFGGIYDWYDPFLAIDAVATARQRREDLTLTFTYHPNAATTPQSVFGRARSEVAARGYSFVRFEPWAPYEERGAFYDRFGLALLTFRSSLETDLAMRTRMFDCFWGDLPVITSPAPGTDAIIESYGSGTVVRNFNADAYADAILGLLESEESYTAALAGCRRWTLDHQWAHVLQPLLEYCSNPKRTATSHEPDSAPLTTSTDTLFARARRKLRTLL